MKSRIEDIPKLRTISTEIESNRFNQVRLGLLRLGGPIRMRLPGLRGMDVIIDNQAWVCVDRTLYDLPVLAWTDFKNLHRSGIHEPVQCLLHYYHVHADLITETVLATIVSVLAERMEEKYPAHAPSVFDLQARRQSA